MNYKDWQDLEMTSQNQQSCQWSSRSLFTQLIRRYHKTLSPSCMIGLSNELHTTTNPEYMSYMCGHRSEKQAQGIMSKILITSMVIRRIKDMCGQVVSVRCPNKEYHDRKNDETDRKGMMIFAWPSGSGYPNQLEAVITYRSTKAYSQRPTLFYKDFMSRWPAWSG